MYKLILLRAISSFLFGYVAVFGYLTFVYSKNEAQIVLALPQIEHILVVDNNVKLDSSAEKAYGYTYKWVCIISRQYTIAQPFGELAIIEDCDTQIRQPFHKNGKPAKTIEEVRRCIWLDNCDF